MFPSQKFKNKHILVAITGGIAAYKVTELVRYLFTQQAKVKVIMTKAAEKFITRLTMETLSQNSVETDLFPDKSYIGTHHIHLADWADATIIAPASYNMISKMHAGIADDLVSSIIAAVHCPTVIAPAMNVYMWNNPILQRNIEDLEKLGYLICPPEEGFLAEGYSGKGRLAPLEHLIQFLYRAIHPAPRSLKGKKVVITAGRTEEALDPVRIFTNRSSGKMGYALAWEAFARGGDITLIHGPNYLPDPVEMKMISVQSAREMLEQVKSQIASTDIYLSAAAIADFTPKIFHDEKIKKSSKEINLLLQPTTDILKYVGTIKKKNQLLVGYAMETDDLEVNAREKLREKNLDMIVHNNVLEKESGFAMEANKVTLLHKNGNKKELPLLPKLDVAFQIFEYLLTQK